MKYNEDVFLEKITQYIASTYDQHYVGDNGIQAIDVWHSLGSAQTTVRDTALKYLLRFVKKDGYNEKDILKAIHYLVLLHYFTYTADLPVHQTDADKQSIKLADIGGGGPSTLHTPSVAVPQHDVVAAAKKKAKRGWLINNDKALP